MKILMLTPYLPYPPSSGGQVRSYNLIKNLSKQHDIFLVSLIKNDSEKIYKEKLAPFCKEIHICKRSESPWTLSNILKSVFGVFPFVVVRNSSPESKKIILQLLSREKFDLIHAETFYIMPHIPETTVPILLVEQTIEYKVYQHYVSKISPLFRPFFYFDIVKLQYWERTFWKKANVVGAVSKDDESKMKELLPNLDTVIIPNAAGEDLLQVYTDKHSKAEPIFLYQGNFSWLQNIEAGEILINDIFPEIQKRIPDARCIIAGQRAQEKLGQVKKKGIKIVDIAASDIESVIRVFKESSIFLAPIEGPGGTRLKVLGAMAAGLPVISSPTGVRGLNAKNGEHVIIARTPQEYAEESIKLLTDKNHFNKIRSNARKMVDTTYSWTAVSKNLEKVYKEMTYTS
jgi:glycosyltransferase involved in cell wall biosynthesis